MVGLWRAAIIAQLVKDKVEENRLIIPIIVQKYRIDFSRDLFYDCYSGRPTVLTRAEVALGWDFFDRNSYIPGILFFFSKKS